MTSRTPRPVVALLAVAAASSWRCGNRPITPVMAEPQPPGSVSGHDTPVLVLHEDAGAPRLVVSPHANWAVASCDEDGFALLRGDAGIVPLALPPVSEPTTLVSDPHGVLLAVAQPNRFLLWDTKRQEVRADGALPPGRDSSLPPSVSFSPKGDRVAFSEGRLATACLDPASSPSTISLWTAASVAPASRISFETRACSKAVWSPDGDTVLTSEGFGNVGNGGSWAGESTRVWRAADAKPIGELAGHSPIFDPTGRYVALTLGHPDKSPGGAETAVYDVTSNKLVAELVGSAVAWSADGKRHVTSISRPRRFNLPSGGGYQVWSMPSGSLVHDGTAGEDEVASPLAASSGSTFAVITTSAERQTLSIHRMSNGEMLRSMDLPPGASVEAVVNDGRVLQMSVEGELPQLVDLQQGARLRVAGRFSDGRCAIAVLDDVGHHDGDAEPIVGYRVRQRIHRHGPVVASMHRAGLLSRILTSHTRP